MEKIITLTIFFFTILQSHAQVTFQPGIRGGLNFAKITQTESDMKADFYVGGFGAIKLTKYYTLQPELTYSRQGGSDLTLVRYDNITGDEIIYNKDITISYISAAIINKFTFNDKFNMHLGPTFDVQTGQEFYTNSDVDLAFILGLGYNITKNFSIEARIKKGIVDVYETDYFSSSYYNTGDYNTNFLFQVGISYAFDLK